MAISRVDDRSSSISYQGAWGRGGATIDYNGSVTYATGGGQTATLTFRGTGIAVYGHIMAQSPGVPAPVSTYSIDGGSPTIYNEVQDGTEHPNQQFYQSPVLSNGQHTIVVTNSFSNHAAFFLDYFLVVAGSDGSDPPSPTPTPPPPTTVTTVVTSAGSSRSTSSSSTTTTGSSSASSSAIRPSSSSRNLNISTSMVNGTIVTVTVVPSSGSSSESNSLIMPPTATMPSNASSTSSNLTIHPGIIIGSCVGGVVTIVLSAIFVYCCLRKRRRDEHDWRKVSGFSNQPHSSEWHEQAGRIQSKLSRSHTQRTENDSHDHLTFSGRPPSYSQEPPLYNPASAPSSSAQSPLPSKLTGFN